MAGEYPPKTVGIDQTTPGTSDSVTVATAQGAGATIGGPSCLNAPNFAVDSVGFLFGGVN